MSSMSKWVVGLALVGLCGCASDKGAKQPEVEKKEAGQPAPEPIRPKPASNEKVSERDTNADGKADVWVYSVEERGAEGQSHARMVRKELDINWDDRVDLTTYYDARGEREREAMDLDFDGKVDSVAYYEKGVNVRKERDLNGDGRTDEWAYYERGKLARKERDSNSDGRVDYWEYWEKDQVDRIGEDLDGDGNVDKWSRNSQTE
ncbi:hypothetical protein JRI60_23970 [Archangium violaceum]|uniref:hypothetical protein n=1 Tax=Archangium violaceum TaxID=83451 RepID=UPI00194EBB8E|nr:hypothetical protein [Archangium violaceum]QRO01855.1 hypothetical protein JRI60_23970 [Archangium violaceum]